MNIFKKLKKYMSEVRSEIKKVSWPSRKVAVKDSTIIVVVSLATAAFLGGMDYALNGIIENLL
ncbi:preprotein translocase subunit SecE [Candidatus Parcubacteria bacterium]|nr:preprotein translocase subunit SecE [Candidatus Parcubacteria bacterium]